MACGADRNTPRPGRVPLRRYPVCPGRGDAVGQHQQTGVIGEQTQTAAAWFGGPADEGVTVFEVKGGRAPSGHGQPLALVDESVAQMLAHQGHVVEVMVLNNGLVAAGDVLGGSEQLEVATLQNALFVSRKVTAFGFAHPGRVEKLGENVPNKMLTPSHPRLLPHAQARPTPTLIRAIRITAARMQRTGPNCHNSTVNLSLYQRPNAYAAQKA